MIYKKEVKNWKENNIFTLKNLAKRILSKYGLKGLTEVKLLSENLAHPKQS